MSEFAKVEIRQNGNRCHVCCDLFKVERNTYLSCALFDVDTLNDGSGIGPETKVFGECPGPGVYYLVPEDKLREMEERAQKAIFLVNKYGTFND